MTSREYARSLGGMRFFTGLVVVFACIYLVGCSKEQEESGGRCPGGAEPRYTVFDLDGDSKGASSPEDALASFLRHEGSDLAVGDFDEVERGARTASFSHTEDGSRLARFYSERFDRGWFVISYETCSGVL